ncbi:MAG: SGNH/GDSL hydrolase family protein [Planctomycetota bacterium]|nr:MAG: SGNH/GDSL hydrolase family protein [Planctomycetota bacterium]
MGKIHAISLIFLICTVPCMLGQGCDFNTVLTDGEDEISSVFILSADKLIPPAVFKNKIYKPSFIFATDSANPQAGQSTGFFLTVAASRPENIQSRLINSETKIKTNLIKVSTPTPSEWSGVNNEPRPFNQTVRDLVSAGNAVYWLNNEVLPGSGFEHRMAVIIPEILRGPFMQLEVYTYTVADGTPIGSDRIEIVDDFFYMAVIGDSIMWGNGLKEEDKFTTLVAETIETEILTKVIKQVFAISGAKIVPAEGDGICTPNCIGEVPKAVTSITVQADLIKQPHLIDLILMDGCINDIGVSTILDPDITEEELIELTDTFCNKEMSGLLRKIRSIAPQAYTAVTAYFPIVSLESEILGLEQWKLTQETNADEGTTKLIETLTAYSIVFHENSIAGLSAAIEAVNQAETGPEMVTLVDPGFGPANAVCTPNSWLWGLTKNGDQTNNLGTNLELIPEDPLLDFRIDACLQSNVVPDLISCLYASVGHPNLIGAGVYAQAIIDRLRIIGILPEAAALQTP